MAGPTRVVPRLPTGPVSGAFTEDPRGRLLAGSGSWLAAPGELRLDDIGGTFDSAAHPAKASIGTSSNGRIRMLKLQLE